MVGTVQALDVLAEVHVIIRLLGPLPRRGGGVAWKYVGLSRHLMAALVEQRPVQSVCCKTYACRTEHCLLDEVAAGNLPVEKILSNILGSSH